MEADFFCIQASAGNICIIIKADAMNSREDTKGRKLPKSFTTGVIALVFLVIGFQTALFIHRASVLSIAANRDEPDTVYVYATPASGSETVNSVRTAQSPDVNPWNDPQKSVAVRKNAGHSKAVQAVRTSLPPKRVETFLFNPNTVSEDELVRLGFTSKQAQSIIKYREKGGRFRRKSDFAKSFVVSDSIFRRLEAYIDIPLLDINSADSAAFDTLPGIGGWFAARMVEYRQRLGGYTCKEQLMEIWKFDREKYEALEDLVTVSRPEPYPLWTLPADSLKLHPHIGNYQTAKAIVLFRENNPKDVWTIEALEEAGVLSDDAASRLSRCLITSP